MRRRVPLARDEREYKADGTSRDQRPHSQLLNEAASAQTDEEEKAV
jgi:hypothetical protein